MKAISDFRSQIQPTLQKTEQLRLEKLKAISSARKWYLVPVGIILMGIASMFSGFIVLAIAMIFIGIIGFFLVAVFKVEFHENSYATSFKEEVFKNFVQKFYPNSTYSPTGYISSDLFAASYLFGGYDDYGGEDYFEGKTTNGCIFKFSELCASTRGSDISTNTSSNATIVFDGMFFVLEVPNRVGGRVLVLPDMAENSLGFLGKFVQKSLGSFFQDAKMVYLEKHPEFEKAFVVYSQNEEEAYKILTPTLIQAIYDLRYKWNVSMRLSFIENQIYVALSTPKNFFQPNIKKSVLNDDLLNELYDELALCFAVVEDLSTGKTGDYHSKSPILDNHTNENIGKNTLNNTQNDSNNNPFLL